MGKKCIDFNYFFNFLFTGERGGAIHNFTSQMSALVGAGPGPKLATKHSLQGSHQTAQVAVT